MINKICIMINEDDCIFSTDDGVNFIPSIGEELCVNSKWYIVIDRNFSYRELNILKFCTIYIYVMEKPTMEEKK